MEFNPVEWNLYGDEIRQATRFYAILRALEKDRVVNTLRVLLERKLALHDGYAHTDDDDVAVIVAGSSIYGDTSPQGYTDIDLFVLAQEGLWVPNPLLERQNNPSMSFAVKVEGQFPEHVYRGNYGPTVPTARFTVSPEDLVAQGLGAVVTVTLMHELRGFDRERSGKPGDFLFSSDRKMGAEEAISRNRERSAQFLVLGRQYEVPQ